MHSLASITPLGHAEPRVVTLGSVRIAEVADRALASVTCRFGREKPFRAAARTLFGTALPEPGKSVAGPVYSLFWTGPDQWFAEAPEASHEDIARIIKEGLGDNASVTEQSGGWARFDLSGAGVVDMLERLAPAPSRRMQTGDATRTAIEHLGCFLICRTAGERFSVIGPRSSAASLHHALCAAAASVA
ncbi:MAG: sarcosine oxidase subunit gamma family protein [Paracoccaceae bacterium]